MSFLKKHITLIGLIFLVAAFVGLFFSRAILSVSTVGMIVLFAFNKSFLNKSLELQNSHKILILLLVWLALSIFYTSNQNQPAFFNEMAFKLSFVGLFLFASTISISLKQLQLILLVMAYAAMLIAIGTFANYLGNYQEINELISKSKPIPIINGYFHISFSFMLGTSVLIMAYFLFFGKPAFRKWLFLVPLLVNFVLMHVVVARTGLVAMYAGLLALIFFYFSIEKGKWIYSTSITLGLMVIGILAISFITPLNNRFNNSMHDLNIYLNGENANWWSGAMRLHALENSWHIFKENPLLGVGMADLTQEVQEMFSKRGTLLLPENRINPHNQFANFMVVGGLPALLLFLLFFGLMIWHSIQYRNWLLLAFVVMAFIGLNLESFLERQFGSCFFGLIFGILTKGDFSRK
ncbi:MAG: O-antigen ligase family protein [Bacteroidia bacterium]